MIIMVGELVLGNDPDQDENKEGKWMRLKDEMDHHEVYSALYNEQIHY